MQTISDATATNGRASDGTFTIGNQAAKGRSSRSADLRRAFAAAVTAEDVAAIASALVAAAKDGDIAAARLVLDRCCGKPVPEDDEPQMTREEKIARIQAISAKLGAIGFDPNRAATNAE